MIPGLSNNGRSMLTTIIVAGTAIGYFAFVFTPQQHAINEMRTHVQERQNYVLETSHLQMAVLQSEKDATRVQQFVDQWRANAPLESRLSRLNAKIAQLGQSAGVSLVRFDPQPVTRHESLWRATTIIGVEGDFSAIFEFVRCLENLGVTAWQESLEIKLAESSAGSDSKLLHSDLSLTVFADRRDFSD